MILKLGDQTVCPAVSTKSSGIYGSFFIDESITISGMSQKWNTPPLLNPLPNGGYFEMEILTGTPSSDYGNVFGFGKYDKIGTYANNYDAVLGYIAYSSGNSTFNLVLRNAGTDTTVSGLSINVVHTIKIDKDYVYVNGASVMSTNYWVTNAEYVAIGSIEGSKRYDGQYVSIKLFS